MLGSALEDMINQCEVFLFLDTTQSVDLADHSTSSAWIHRELHYTRYLKVENHSEPCRNLIQPKQYPLQF